MGAVHHLLQGLLRGFVPHASCGVFLDRRRLRCVRLDMESHDGRPPGPLRSAADVERALLPLLHIPGAEKHGQKPSSRGTGGCYRLYD